jgi:hypothetical protein
MCRFFLFPVSARRESSRLLHVIVALSCAIGQAAIGVNDTEGGIRVRPSTGSRRGLYFEARLLQAVHHLLSVERMNE